MRTDSAIKSIRSGFNKPARRGGILRRFLVVSIGVVLVATLVPAVAQAQNSAYIYISKIDGKFVVQGKKFAPGAKGIVKAEVAGLRYQNHVTANKNGYFWTTFNSLNHKYGKAWAGAWIKNGTKSNSRYIRETTKKKLTAPKGRSGGLGGGVIHIPPTTRPQPSTTTTVPQSPPTTKPKPGGVSGGGVPVTTEPPSNPGSGSGSNTTGDWKLVEQDNFDSNSLNSNLWGTYEGKGNQGVGYRKRSAVTVGDGELRITGNGDVAGGVAMKEAQLYGKYEIRSRLDDKAGYNTATLLWPVSERWPSDVEVDISEIFHNAYGNSGSFLHYGSPHQRLHRITKGLDTSKWHTYGVEWEPNKLTWTLDGKAIWTVTNKYAIPHKQHFLALQLDVAKAAASERVSGTTFHVDWVKVYKKG